MIPASALLRFHWRLMGAGSLPLLVGIVGAAVLAVPASWCAFLAIIGYLVAIAVPWSSWTKPSTVERCLPATWGMLRRARAGAHLAVAASALLPLAALALRGGSQTRVDGRTILVLALLIPLWPMLCVVGAPLSWQLGAWGAATVAIMASAAMAMTCWLGVVATTSPMALAAAAGVGAISLIIMPVACLSAGRMETSATVFTADPFAAPAGPPPPAKVRWWRAIATSLDRLPPTVRALLLGVWLRPRFLYLSLALPMLAGCLSAASDAGTFLALIAFSSLAQFDRMGEATIGGLLPRRLGFAALVLPPMLAFAASYAICGRWHPPAPEIAVDAISPERAADPRQRSLRASVELTQLRLAHPSGDRAALPDGSTMTVADWFGRRADANSAPLTASELSVSVARAIEREDDLRVDPARLISSGPGASGLRRVSSAPVAVEIAAARWWRALLFGLAVLTFCAAMVAGQVGWRERQRSCRPLLSYRIKFLIFATLFLGLGPIAWWAGMAPIKVPADLSLPLTTLEPWDQVVVWAVAHAWSVGGGLAAGVAALLCLAWRNARYLPLIPDRVRVTLP